MTTELLPCEADHDQLIHDREVEIRTLVQTARAIVDISPIAAKVIRDTARALVREQDKALRARHGARKR